MPENKNNTSLPDYMTDKRGIQLKTATPVPNSPGTFTVSEEEAAKLRAMAMANNGSEMSPEMQAAMGMVDGGDYDQKIPKNVHNHICYDEAKKNNEQYRKEATEFTDAIVPDNATKELLDEAEATTNLSNFEFGDITEYLAKLEELSFLEAVSFKKKIDAEIARWKSCKSMLKAISDLKLDDNVNRELMKINALEDYKFEETAEDFEKNYEVNLDKLTQIANKLASIVNSHKDEMNSTAFLSQEMVHLMNGKLAKLTPDMLNYELTKKKMETVIEAFTNRMDLTYLEEKFSIYLKTNKNAIRKYFKEDGPILRSGRRSKIINDLIRFFSNDIVYALQKNLKEIFHDDYDVTYLVMGFLAKIMNGEKKTSKDSWAKVLILNFSDIDAGIFDIDEPEGYAQKVSLAFQVKAIEFLEKHRLSLNMEESIFGLRDPGKKEEKLTSEEITEIEKEVEKEPEDESIETDEVPDVFEEEVPTVEAEVVSAPTHGVPNQVVVDAENVH